MRFIFVFFFFFFFFCKYNLIRKKKLKVSSHVCILYIVHLEWYWIKDVFLPCAIILCVFSFFFFFYWTSFSLFSLLVFTPFPKTPTKETMDFLIAERRDERKAVRTQDIRDIKGLKQRVSMHGIYIRIIRNSNHEWIPSLILSFIIFFNAKISVSTQSTPHRHSNFFTYFSISI